MTVIVHNPLELLTVARDRIANTGWCKHDMVRFDPESSFWDDNRQPVSFCTLGALTHDISDPTLALTPAAELVRNKVIELDPESELIHKRWSWEPQKPEVTISIPEWNDTRSDKSEVLAVLDAVIDDLKKEQNA